MTRHPDKHLVVCVCKHVCASIVKRSATATTVVLLHNNNNTEQRAYQSRIQNGLGVKLLLYSLYMGGLPHAPS